MTNVNRFAIIGSRGFPSTYGGFETFVRRLAPYLVACGDSVTVYGRAKESGVSYHDGVRCVTTRGIDSNALSTLSFGATAAFHARHCAYTAALVMNVANGYFLPLLTRSGIRSVVNPDGIEWERAKWNRFGKKVFKGGAILVAKYADSLVYDSREIGAVWNREFRRSGTYIPYGADVDLEVADDRVQEIGLRPGSYVLVVARLVPENNVDLFLDAFELLQSSAPVVIVGSANRETPLSRRLRALAAARKGFLWLGHVSDQTLLKQLWAHASLYYHGHSVGGTNPALLQALGYGAPTIALDTPYNAEVVQSKEQLFRRDVRALSQLLNEVLSSADKRRAFSRHGVSVISQRYRWDDVLQRYRAVLVNDA